MVLLATFKQPILSLKLMFIKLNWRHFLTLSILLAGLIIHPSCRKIDQQADETKSSTPQSKFFTDHASNKPLILAINQYFKRLNDKEGFIDKTIKKIGHPRWDKAITVSFSGSLNRGESNSTELTYIPFVREEETFVNASLLVQTSPTDTAFKYVCDWEYQYRQNGTLEDTSVTAERIAFTLMTLDKEVFGHTKYKITDTKLFENYFPDSLRGNQSYLELDSVSGFGNRTEAMAAPITFTVYCGACVSMYWQIIYYYNLNGIPTWEFPSGGGGGGSTSTPPDCPGIPVARTENVINPCEPGWIPIPPTEPPINPCDKVASLKTDSLFKADVNDLKNRLTENKEYAYLHKSTGGRQSFHTGVANQCEVSVSINTVTTPKLKSYIHSHNNTCPLPIFSPDDLKTLYELYSMGKTDSVFTFGVITDVGVYLMVIDDALALDNFYTKYFTESGSSDADNLSRKYNAYKIKRTNTPEENEKRFLEFLKDEGVGLKLLKANNDLSGYSTISLNRDKNRVVTPCPQ